MDDSNLWVRILTIFGSAMTLIVGVTVQNVNYTNLRTALLASATLSGEVAPVLPQLN